MVDSRMNTNEKINDFTSNWSIFLNLAIRAAISGGEEIMALYKKAKIRVNYKKDASPVTSADENANRVIIQNLHSQEEWCLPVISEESDPDDYSIRKKWPALWLVDPLDGTSEFLKRTDEFGVMIALIMDRRPVLGVIHLPVQNLLYLGVKGKCACKIADPKLAASISDDPLEGAVNLPLSTKPSTYTLVQSKFHLSASDEEYKRTLKRRFPLLRVLHVGSCLKYTFLAENLAHEYTRMTSIHEWDVAAGQALIEAAGGSICDLQGIPLRYNREDLSIPVFQALA